MDPFHRLRDAAVHDSPFAHAVVDDFLDRDVIDTLTRELPSMDVLSGGAPLASYERRHYHLDALLDHPGISDTWKSFLRAGADQRVLSALMTRFSPQIHAAYPDFEERFGPLDRLQVRSAADAGCSRSSVTMSVQLAVHAPLHEGHDVGLNEHGPHLDQENKLFVAALYFRTGADRSDGGGLDLYEPLGARVSFGPKRSVPPEQVRTVKTIPYRRNTFVAVLNSPRALHGVAPRGPTPEPRYSLLIAGKLSRKLFRADMTPIESGAFRSRMSRLARRWFHG